MIQEKCKCGKPAIVGVGVDNVRVCLEHLKEYLSMARKVIKKAIEKTMEVK